METSTKHEGGVRKYLKRSWLQRIRQGVHQMRLGQLGSGSYLDKNVQFLRHPSQIFIGAEVIIKENARLCVTNPKAIIKIGDWTTIGYHTHIFSNKSVTIGNNCLIAPFCYLVDTNHGFSRGKLIRKQAMSSRQIVIEDDVWLGAGVTVLRGVTIKRGAIVSAGSVVTEDVEENAIVQGNPAILIEYRK